MSCTTTPTSAGDLPGSYPTYPGGKFNAYYDQSQLWYGGKAPGDSNAKPLRRAGYEGQSWLDALQQLYPQQLSASQQAAGDYAGLATDTLGRLTQGRGAGSVQAATAAVNGIDPTALAIRQALGQQVLGDVQAGSGFTNPQELELQRQAIQAARARGAGMGLGASNISSADELLAQFNLGQQLLQQRQASALGYLGNQYQTQTAPVLQQSQFGDASNAELMKTLLGGTLTAPVTDPFNVYNSDIQNTNLNSFYENLFNKRQADAASSAGGMSVLGAGMGLVGNLGGAAIGGFMKPSAPSGGGGSIFGNGDFGGEAGPAVRPW